MIKKQVVYKHGAMMLKKFIRKMRWRLYKRISPFMPVMANKIRPDFANAEGKNVQWFGLHLVERREGGGYISVGENCRIEATLICHRSTSQIKIGSRVSLGGGTVIESLKNIEIGDDCLISHHCTIQDHNSHPVEWEYRKDDVLNWLNDKKEWSHVMQRDVVIGSKCWVGTRVVILKGVCLGEGTIVGAGSVVTKSFPPYSIIAGNPARLIRLQAPSDMKNRPVSAENA